MTILNDLWQLLCYLLQALIVVTMIYLSDLAITYLACMYKQLRIDLLKKFEKEKVESI